MTCSKILSLFAVLFFTFAVTLPSDCTADLVDFAPTVGGLALAPSSSDLANGATVSDIHIGGGNGAASLLVDGSVGGLGFNNGGVNGSNGGGGLGGQNLAVFIDLGSAQSLGLLNIFSAGSSAANVRQNQDYAVYGSNDPAATITDVRNNVGNFTLLGGKSTLNPGPAGNEGFGVTQIDLGGANFQFLIFEFANVGNPGGGETSIIHEIDVFAVPEPNSLGVIGLAVFGLIGRRRRV